MSDKDEMPIRTEVGPHPIELEELVDGLLLEPGWTAELQNRKRDFDHGRGEASGLTLVIVTLTYDTYHPENGRTYQVNHFFPVPITTWNRQSWQRWLFDQYLTVLQHEAMEFFQIRDDSIELEDECKTCSHPAARHDGRDSSCDDCAGEDDLTIVAHRFKNATTRRIRPYAPNHGPGYNPYIVRELTTDEERRIQYTGKLDHK